jgi:hypothetical protein
VSLSLSLADSTGGANLSSGAVNPFYRDEDVSPWRDQLTRRARVGQLSSAPAFSLSKNWNPSNGSFLPVAFRADGSCDATKVGTQRDDGASLGPFEDAHFLIQTVILNLG